MNDHPAMTDDVLPGMRDGVHPAWQPMVDALHDEIGIDETTIRFESNDEMLNVHCDVKGLESSYYLDARTLFQPHLAAAEAQAIAEHVLHARWLDEGDHIAPLERRLARDGVVDAVASHAGMDMQALLDEVWGSRVAARANGTDSRRFRWATAPNNPEMLHGRQGRPGVEPRTWKSGPVQGVFMAGDLAGVGWEFDTIVLEDRLAIHYENKGIVVAFRDRLPEAMLASLKGRPLSRIVTHPALDPLDFRITAARFRGQSTAIWIRVVGSTLPKPIRERPPAPPSELPRLTAAFVDLANRRH